MNKGLKIIGGGATLMMYIVLMMGALVTNTGSGDGCGASWPLCKNSFMPDWDYHAIIEASHRGVTGIAGLLVAALVIGAWVKFGTRPVKVLASLATLSILVQSALGAAVVFWPQPKTVLALHFGISMICFSSVFLLTVIVFQAGKRAPAQESMPLSPQFVNWTWTVMGFSYAVMYLGAYVRHMKASMACLGWPLCNGELIPTLYGLTGVHFIHRVGAALLTLMVVRLWFMARQTGRKDVILAANLALLLIIAQVISGATFAFGSINLLKQMLHSAIVTAFGGALSYICLQVLPGTAYNARKSRTMTAGV